MRQSIKPVTTGPPLVLTLDAGGTNFAYSAVRNNELVGETITLPSMAHDLEACLDQIIGGLTELHNNSGRQAAAISIAFPGPAELQGRHHRRATIEFVILPGWFLLLLMYVSEFLFLR